MDGDTPQGVKAWPLHLPWIQAKPVQFRPPAINLNGGCMSSSYSTIVELRKLADELYIKANQLEEAANLLQDLADTENLSERIKGLKERAKGWMSR